MSLIGTDDFGHPTQNSESHYLHLLGEAVMEKNGVYILGGVSGIAILTGIILASELGAAIYGGDTGALLWTTLHFVINPILCVAYIVITIIKWARAKDKIKNYYPLGIAVAILYIYISVTGNTLWLDLLRIDFNNK